MDPAKQAAMSDSAKLAREKDLERYDLFPMYPTGNVLFSTSRLTFHSHLPDRSFPSRRQRRDDAL